MARDRPLGYPLGSSLEVSGLFLLDPDLLLELFGRDVHTHLLLSRLENNAILRFIESFARVFKFEEVRADWVHFLRRRKNNRIHGEGPRLHEVSSAFL